jgi:hypothetical protein
VADSVNENQIISLTEEGAVRWKAAVLLACNAVGVKFDENNIDDTIQNLIEWHCKAAIEAAYGEPETEAPAPEPDAWLFKVWRQGVYEVAASISEDESFYWPIDKIRKVTRQPLYTFGPIDTIIENGERVGN